MHVVFISKCEARAINKTRMILDGYANRIGDFTWATPITLEALSEIKSQLKKVATRQTSVACYQNYGTRKIKLIWTVGNNKYFGKNGEIAINIRKHTNKSPTLPWINEACLIAKYAGLMHDIGKINKFFNEKLSKSTPIADPVRHELLSGKILKEFLNGKTWNEILDFGYISFKKDTSLIGEYLSSEKLNNAEDAIMYCVLTHHRFFSDRKAELTNHLQLNSKNSSFETELCHHDLTEIKKIIQHTVSKIKGKDWSKKIDNYWLGIAFVARAALILADHKVSADKSNLSCLQTNKPVNQLFANTSEGFYNQTLAYHLSSVGNEANKFAYQMVNFDGECLSEESIESITKQALIDRFKWQNEAVSVLKKGIPSLVLNIASTGSGKTRSNIRIATSLRENNIRLTTVLNLRTLTVQTGKSYSQELSIPYNELAVVVGDSVTKKIKAYEECDLTQEECDEDEIIPYLVSDTEFKVPEFLKGFGNDFVNGSVISAPLLVSTLDYIIDAGDPTKQRNHAIALIRLMHSDLIIDEIDSLEPSAITSILRLVRISAMFGRNVIISSATLPLEIANFIHKSYFSGYKIYQSMNDSKTDFLSYVIDNSIKPEIIKSDDFDLKYKSHLIEIMKSNNQKPITKKAEIKKINLNKPFVTNYANDIIDSINKMHALHSNLIPNTNKRISFGVIRMANIKPAIKLSKNLSTKGFYVCCYHSRHFAIQRYVIEKRLDYLLKRTNGDNHIYEDEEIKKIIENSESNDIKIIIVATPVEEVGRDHDFDYAIIEPSSIQSIVQMAGRVNRHRLTTIFSPNIVLLQYNRKFISYRNNEKIRNKLFFTNPGNQTSFSHDYNNANLDYRYDLCRLIDESKINERLDANLRFDTSSHLFSKYDSNAITDKLNELLNPIINNETVWISSDLYKKAKLRESNDTELWYYGKDLKWYKSQYTSKGQEWVSKSNISIKNDFNGLFTKSMEELCDLANDIGLRRDEAFKFSIYKSKEEKNYKFNRFGCQKIE